MEIVRKTTTALVNELGKVVLGYDDAKRKIVLALFADSHILLESVPGLAKTLLVETLQRVVANSTSQVLQFTPDLRPSDIIGFQMLDPETRRLIEVLGPVVGTNFFLADEINRAPGKTQASLLRAMQERKVVVGGKVIALKDPFLTLATMNPIEQEGTFPLMEAQLDRFGMKIPLDYVSEEDELKMLQNIALGRRNAHLQAQPVIDVAQIVELRTMIEEGVYTSEALLRYIIALVRSTRPRSTHFEALKASGPEGKKVGELIKNGASPRAEQTLQKLSRVRAAMQGRDFVLPEDVRFVAPDVLRHRIMLSDDAVFDNVSPDVPVGIVIKNVAIVDDVELYKRR